MGQCGQVRIQLEEFPKMQHKGSRDAKTVVWQTQSRVCPQNGYKLVSSCARYNVLARE